LDQVSAPVTDTAEIISAYRFNNVSFRLEPIRTIALVFLSTENKV